MKTKKTIAVSLIPLACVVIFLLDYDMPYIIYDVILVMYFLWPIAIPLLISKINKSFGIREFSISLASIISMVLILFIDFAFESDLEYIVIIVPVVEVLLISCKLFKMDKTKKGK